MELSYHCVRAEAWVEIFFAAFFRFSGKCVCEGKKSYFLWADIGCATYFALSRWVSQNWVNYRSFSAGFIGNCTLEISQKGIIGPFFLSFQQGLWHFLHQGAKRVIECIRFANRWNYRSISFQQNLFEIFLQFSSLNWGKYVCEGKVIKRAVRGGKFFCNNIRIETVSSVRCN